MLFSEEDAMDGDPHFVGDLRSDGKWTVLIVDDEKDIHDVTVLALKRLEYEGRGLSFLSAYSAAEGLKLLRKNPDVAVVLLDVVMEKENAGLAMVRQIREELQNDRVRIVLRTGHPGQAPEESVTLDYDINDYREKTELTARSLRTVLITALRSYRAIDMIHNLNQEIDATQRELMYTLGEIAENRSIETGHHVRRVGEIAAILARGCNLSPGEVESLHMAASMHDLGKLAIEDSILNKPGQLTPAEFELMKKHCDFGYELLCHSKRPLLQMAAVVAQEHHENFDGTGYPKGIREHEINLYSRIVALVDVFDALGTRRVYKNPWPQEKILDFIRAESGRKFDPQLVDLFFENIEEIRLVAERWRDE